MKIEAKQRLSANWQSDLGDIKNPDIVAAVKELATFTAIRSVGTEGYNEDASGCEVYFTGKQNSMVGYDNTFMHPGTLTKFAKFVEACAGKGMELSFGPSADDAEFVLIILGD